MFMKNKKERRNSTVTFFKPDTFFKSHVVGGVELTFPTIQSELEDLKKAKPGEDKSPSKPERVRKPK